MQQRYTRPPFAQQAGNPARLRELNERIKRSYESIRTQELAGVEADYQLLAERYPADFFLPLQWGTILGESGRWAEAVPVLLKAQRRLPLHVETRLPAVHALCRVGQPEEAACLLAGEGPPYGLYLADYAWQLMRTLLQDGYPAEARRFQAALLDLVPRFPQRDRVAAWTEIQDPGP